MKTDEDTVADLDNILNAPDAVKDNDQLVLFAKKTVERLTLLADLFCEAADSEDGNFIHMNDEIEQALEEHQRWRRGDP